MIRIEVRGLNEIVRALSDPNLIAEAVAPGFERAGTIVQAAWQRRAHTVTRKYQSSIGHVVSGLRVVVGPQPGFGAPRRYSASQSSAWRKPRAGVNRGDPRTYARFEDQGTRYRPGHPAAEPALRDNLDEIVDAIVSGISAALDRRLP